MKRGGNITLPLICFGLAFSALGSVTDATAVCSTCPKSVRLLLFSFAPKQRHGVADEEDLAGVGAGGEFGGEWLAF